jgi:hypothetical protein
VATSSLNLEIKPSLGTGPGDEDKTRERPSNQRGRDLTPFPSQPARSQALGGSTTHNPAVTPGGSALCARL